MSTFFYYLSIGCFAYVPFAFVVASAANARRSLYDRRRLAYRPQGIGLALLCGIAAYIASKA